MLNTDMSQRQVFFYLPWIRQHGDILMDDVLDEESNVTLVPLRFCRSEDHRARRGLLHFAVRHPTAFARLLEQRMLSQTGIVHGLILTLDWIGPMRVAVNVAKAHGLPVILLPHEGIFLDEEKFYTNPMDGTNLSSADRFLAWGEQHRDVMCRRGMPDEAITMVGSPKLQAAAHYVKQLSDLEYARRINIDPDRPHIMFAAQTLDNVADMPGARAQQAQAVLDTWSACQELGYGLVVRLPPVEHVASLADTVRATLGTDGPRFMSMDESRPETDGREALCHASAVVSISSTMLLEKAVMGGSALVLDYIDETSLFVTRGRLPAASDRDTIRDALATMVPEGNNTFPAKGWQQMQDDFSYGGFGKGLARKAILKALRAYNKPHFLSGRPGFFVGRFKTTPLLMLVHRAVFRMPYGKLITRWLFWPFS